MVPGRVLVTGATGFVGGYLRAAIADRWPDALVFGLAANELEAVPGMAVVDLLDRAGLNAFVSRTRPDVVVHLAGQASVAHSTQSSAATWDVNVTGSLNLANAIAAQVPDSTLLFASSSEVYGASFLAGPVTETTPVLPMSPYAKSKAAAERLLADVLPPQARLVVARPCNHTGVGQRTAFVLPSFAEQIAQIEVGHKPPRLEVGNLDVSREFLDVHDVVDAYLSLIEAAQDLPRRFTCNVACGDPRPLRERVDFMRSISTVRFEIVVDPARLRPVDLPIVSSDASLLRAVTGWAPRVDLETTLTAMLEAARAQQRNALSA